MDQERSVRSSDVAPRHAVEAPRRTAGPDRPVPTASPPPASADVNTGSPAVLDGVFATATGRVASALNAPLAVRARAGSRIQRRIVAASSTEPLPSTELERIRLAIERQAPDAEASLAELERFVSDGIDRTFDAVIAGSASI